MREYYPHAYPEECTAAQLAPQSVPTIEENLATEYDMPDLNMFLPSAPSTSTNPTRDCEDTIKAEFRRYTTDALASPDTDIIGFWSVSAYFIH